MGRRTILRILSNTQISINLRKNNYCFCKERLLYFYLKPNKIYFLGTEITSYDTFKLFF